MDAIVVGNRVYAYAVDRYNGKIFRLVDTVSLIGIKNISNEIPELFVLYQNYPNPFNPSTKIKFSLPLPSQGGALAVWLVIYDILGREVAALVNEKLAPGTYEVEWDASNFPSGVYFCSMQAGDFKAVQKMVLLK